MDPYLCGPKKYGYESGTLILTDLDSGWTADPE
jgi:hypothetical protein